MRPADLWRRTSFRLALGVTLLVLTALLLASAAGYSLMHRQLAARQDARVTEIFTALRQTSLGNDEQDLIEAVNARVTASPDKSTVFLLRNATGQVLAANIRDVWVKPGWSTVEAATLEVATDYPYRIFAGKLGKHWLVVGLTNADLDDLAEIVFGAFGWAMLFALILAMAAGAWVATRVQRRLAEVEGVLARLARGDLTARLPVTQRGDDLDHLASAINLSLARLGSVVEAMRQVSTDIAHDLRTPLNRLRIHIDDATAHNDRGAPVADDLAAALAESETIGQTFSALLRIAQIEAGARRERFGTVNISEVLADVTEVYCEVAEDAGMTLGFHAGSPALVQGDRELLTQMFANLIENAIRHCPAGTAITCAAEVHGDEVAVSVSDDGPGIPANERDNVLRRLYRLEKSRTTAGSGLGLALVKAVADLHGARLTLGDATPGLRVEIVFPVAGTDR
jgi:signal transduction histidine kinase